MDQFLSLMNAGKNYLDQGDATNALAIYKRAEAIVPNDADLRLNLANSYLLSQALIRAGREEEAQRELQQHQTNIGGGGPATGAATFERSKYTQARVPFRLDQPEKEGIRS